MTDRAAWLDEAAPLDLSIVALDEDVDEDDDWEDDDWDEDEDEDDDWDEDDDDEEEWDDSFDDDDEDAPRRGRPAWD